ELFATDVNHDGVTDLGDSEAYRVNLTKPSTTLWATQYDSKEGGFAGENPWITPDGISMIMPANRSISYLYDVETAGTYDLGLSLRMAASAGIHGKNYIYRMEVLVDGQSAGEIRIAADGDEYRMGEVPADFTAGIHQVTFRWVNDAQIPGGHGLEIRSTYMRASSQDIRLDQNKDGAVSVEDYLLWQDQNPVTSRIQTLRINQTDYDVIRYELPGTPMAFRSADKRYLSDAQRQTVIIEGVSYHIKELADNAVELREILAGDVDANGLVDRNDLTTLNNQLAQYSKTLQGVDFAIKSDAFRYSESSIVSAADAEAKYNFSVPQDGWYVLEVDGGSAGTFAYPAQHFFNL
ncbi:MAG: hypothetical protein HYZ83_01715, partial [Candidatus Omnitrophica bacterium]|nr:hypothetical protein [Candidatus Omnitrophota bacterium]